MERLAALEEIVGAGEENKKIENAETKVNNFINSVKLYYGATHKIKILKDRRIYNMKLINSFRNDFIKKHNDEFEEVRQKLFVYLYNSTYA